MCRLGRSGCALLTCQARKPALFHVTMRCMHPKWHSTQGSRPSKVSALPFALPTSIVSTEVRSVATLMWRDKKPELMGNRLPYVVAILLRNVLGLFGWLANSMEEPVKVKELQAVYLPYWVSEFRLYPLMHILTTHIYLSSYMQV